jgi:hypothetical protein
MSDRLAKQISRTVARASGMRMRRGTVTAVDRVTVHGGVVLTVTAWVAQPAVGGQAVVITDGAGGIVGLGLDA